MPGDTLVARLEKVSLNRASAAMYSHTLNRKAVQADHEQTPAENWSRDWPLNRRRGEARIVASDSALADLKLPVKPMIGSVGAAPPLNTALYAGDLWVNGGNLDYNRITEGMTLYLPVFRAGAHLMFGDGHALQGDGEISGQWLETSLDIEFAVDLIEGENLGYIWSENEDDVIVHGVDNTLDSALQMATSGMARWLKKTYGLNDSEIAALMSASIRYDVAVVVNTRPHVVARLSKETLGMIRPRSVPE